MTTKQPASPELVCGETDVFSFFDAEGKNPQECREQTERNIYLQTACGAWIEWRQTGITVGSMVEGCDLSTAAYPLDYPFSQSDLQARIDAVEAEADALWKWANVRYDKIGRLHRNGKTQAERGADAPALGSDRFADISDIDADQADRYYDAPDPELPGFEKWADEYVRGIARAALKE